MHPKRHPIRHGVPRPAATPTGGSPRCGCRMIGDSGAYASVGMKVLERAAGHASGPYHVPAIDVESVAVRTNNPVCGAFRGFGANQAQFAMEGVLDRLAEQVGISGWEIRKRNVITPGDGVGAGPDHGRRLPRRRALPRRDQAALRRAPSRPGKAVGLGLGLKNSGLGNGFKEIAKAVVRFRDDGTRRGAPLLDRDGPGRPHRRPAGRGRGARRRPGPHPGRSSTRPASSALGQTTGSRGTLMGAGAVADAVPRRRMADGCRLGVDYEGEYRVDWTQQARRRARAPGHPLDVRLRRAARGRSTARRGAIERVVAAHDVGRAVNPLLCEGQIEGSVHMGLGYALTEDFPADAETGRPRT